MKKVKNAFITVRKWATPILTIFILWLIKVVNIGLRIILVALFFASITGFLVVPFLSTVISFKLSHWIWYPSCAALIALLILFYVRDKEPTDTPPVVIFLGKWGLLLAGIVFVSIFVFNYYSIDLIWKWILFAVGAIYILLFFLSLLAFDLKHHDRDEEERQIAGLNTCKNIILYLLFDLFYLAIFNNWLVPKLIFGILALILVSFNLFDAFLNGARSLRFFIVLELLFSLFISGYLIWIIPNPTLQNIVLSILAALLGGIFTLLGVAWTIKKGEADRQADMWKMEEYRKEESRLKLTPYIKIASDMQTSQFVRVTAINDLDFTKEADLRSIQNNTFYVVKIPPFAIKNVSASNILLKGIYINDIYHPFAPDNLVESSGKCQVHVSMNNWFAFPEEITSIRLLISDILLNEYVVVCYFSSTLDQIPQKEILPNNSEYTVKSYIYHVQSVSLPTLH